jgi:hypothetical protein
MVNKLIKSIIEITLAGSLIALASGCLTKGHEYNRDINEMIGDRIVNEHYGGHPFSNRKDYPIGRSIFSFGL